MILIEGNPIRGPLALEGVGPENGDFFGPSPSLALCTEQFRNQQLYEKCVRYAAGT
jgi:hypothetical protein